MHLITRGNNKILRIPPSHNIYLSTSLVAPFPNSKQINHPFSIILTQRRCQITSITTLPICNTHIHNTYHLFFCTHIRTTLVPMLKTTHPTSGVALTVVANCRANCVETSRPHALGPDLRFFAKQAMLDIERNPGPTTTHKENWICDICHKLICGRKHISIRCNRIEHWVNIRCAGIRLAQYTDTWTCYQHK